MKLKEYKEWILEDWKKPPDRHELDKEAFKDFIDDFEDTYKEALDKTNDIDEI